MTSSYVKCNHFFFNFTVIPLLSSECFHHRHLLPHLHKHTHADIKTAVVTHTFTLNVTTLTKQQEQSEITSCVCGLISYH